MMRLEELKNELVGEEFSFSMLDEKMMEAGFYSNMDEGLDWVDIAFSGVIYYVPKTDDMEQVRIEFQTLRENMIPEVYNGVESIDIVVTSVEED